MATDYISQSNYTSTPLLDDFLFGTRNAYTRELESLGFQNDFNAEQSALTRSFNAEEAQKNRDWQEYMSNTAYQRAMSDAKKAGINPALVFQNGGASVGTGSQASASSAYSSSGVNVKKDNSFQTIVSAIAGIANSAMRFNTANLQLKTAQQWSRNFGRSGRYDDIL